MSDIEPRRPIATMVSDYVPNFIGHAILYKLDQPVSYPTFTFADDEPDVRGTTEYVVASSVSIGWANETLVFPTDADGMVVDWLQLGEAGPGEHREAMEDAGFVVA